MVLFFLMFPLFVNIIQLFYTQVCFISKGLEGTKLIVKFLHATI
jgi:hypothetical protein